MVLPPLLKAAGRAREMGRLPQTDQDIDDAQARHRAAHISALHRVGQLRPVQVLGGKHQQVILAPRWALHPRQNNQQRADLEADQDEEDDCELSRHIRRQEAGSSRQDIEAATLQSD